MNDKNMNITTTSEKDHSTVKVNNKSSNLKILNIILIFAVILFICYLIISPVQERKREEEAKAFTEKVNKCTENNAKYENDISLLSGEWYDDENNKYYFTEPDMVETSVFDDYIRTLDIRIEVIDPYENDLHRMMDFCEKYDAEHSKIYDLFCVPENHAVRNYGKEDRCGIFSIPIFDEFETLILADDFPKFPTDYLFEIDLQYSTIDVAENVISDEGCNNPVWTVYIDKITENELVMHNEKGEELLSPPTHPVIPK